MSGTLASKEGRRAACSALPVMGQEAVPGVPSAGSSLHFFFFFKDFVFPDAEVTIPL